MSTQTTKKMSAKQRSEAARKAARAAWKTMNSAAYKKAAKRGRPAVEKYLAAR